MKKTSEYDRKRAKLMALRIKKDIVKDLMDEITEEISYLEDQIDGMESDRDREQIDG